MRSWSRAHMMALVSSGKEKEKESSSDQGGSVGWEWSCTVKDHWFNSQSGHIPALWVWSPVGACMGGSQSMFLSHINVSLPFFLPAFLCLSKKKKKYGEVPPLPYMSGRRPFPDIESWEFLDFRTMGNICCLSYPVNSSSNWLKQTDKIWKSKTMWKIGNIKIGTWFCC